MMRGISKTLMAVAIGCVLVTSGSGCSAVKKSAESLFVAPQTPQQGIAYANGAITVAAKETVILLDAKVIKTEDAKTVFGYLTQASQYVDLAVTALKVPNAESTAQGYLGLANDLISKAQVILANYKGVQ